MFPTWYKMHGEFKLIRDFWLKVLSVRCRMINVPPNVHIWIKINYYYLHFRGNWHRTAHCLVCLGKKIPPRCVSACSQRDERRGGGGVVCKLHGQIPESDKFSALAKVYAPHSKPYITAPVCICSLSLVPRRSGKWAENKVNSPIGNIHITNHLTGKWNFIALSRCAGCNIFYRRIPFTIQVK